MIIVNVHYPDGSTKIEGWKRIPDLDIKTFYSYSDEFNKNIYIKVIEKTEDNKEVWIEYV